MLAREILLCESFQHNVGSKERGSVLSQIATNLNTHPVQGSQCHRELLGIVTASSKQKSQKRKREIEIGSGVSPEDSELDLALEEIIEKWEAADQEFQLDNQSKTKQLEHSVLLKRGHPIQMSQWKRKDVKSGEVAATQSSF